MKKSKYNISALTEDNYEELFHVANDLGKVYDYFCSDCPMVLDDEQCDAFSDWFCDSFPEYLEKGAFDEQLGKALSEMLEKQPA